MKVHTTNYINTFIEVAEDCPIHYGEIPPAKSDKRSLARMQYDMLAGNDYVYTSDNVIFQVYAEKNDLTPGELKAAREQFFSKGKPCLRSSPLTKRYGWGIHCNSKGKIALVGSETKDYQEFKNDKSLQIVKAMRSKRK